jgi:hypothetical protein
MKVEQYRENVLVLLQELKTTNAAQSSDIAEIKVDIREQNGRLRAVERDVSKAKGVGIAVSGLFATVLGWLGLK